MQYSKVYISIYVLVLCGLFEPRTEYVTTVTRDREWDELKLVEAVWSIGKKVGSSQGRLRRWNWSIRAKSMSGDVRPSLQEMCL